MRQKKRKKKKNNNQLNNQLFNKKKEIKQYKIIYNKVKRRKQNYQKNKENN